MCCGNHGTAGIYFTSSGWLGLCLRATIGDGAFPAAAASIRNGMPKSVWSWPSLPVFFAVDETEHFARSHGLQFFQLSSTATKLYHIKCDHPACVSADGGQFEQYMYDVNWVVALNMA